MAAQAKPFLSFDSPLTENGGGGSLFVPVKVPCAEGNATGGGLLPATTGSLPLGLYVHVPFCSSTCDFCAFYQEKPSRRSIDLYLEAVAAELAQMRAEIELGAGWLWQGERWAAPLAAVPVGASCGGGGGVASRRTFTVFFGGGTPGLLAAKDLARLCRMVRDTLDDFGEILEWTIELAPATVRPDGVKALLEHGVNRFSLGVQSFSDALLEGLGRQHSREQIFRAYDFLRTGGVTNLSCDLMFALPGQTREAWLTDLQTLADLGPEHISTYCLTFEEDTAMWVKLSQGRYKLDPEREADLYRETWAWLADKGYAQYEVSNFARPGYHSLHNLTTWSMGRWRGIGPSAASQWGGWRFQNPANLEAWANAVLATARGGGFASDKNALAESPATLANSAIAPVPVAVPLASCQQEEEGVLASKAAHAPVPAPPAPCEHPPASCQHPPAPANERARVAPPLGNVPSTFPQGVKLPQLLEERVELTNRLLAADALIFGLRRRDGVVRAEWLARFAPVATDAAENAGAGALPLQEVEALFKRFATEGLLDMAALAADVWRLNDEGLLLADAVGSALLECFEGAE